MSWFSHIGAKELRFEVELQITQVKYKNLPMPLYLMWERGDKQYRTKAMPGDKGVYDFLDSASEPPNPAPPLTCPCTMFIKKDKFQPKKSKLYLRYKQKSGGDELTLGYVDFDISTYLDAKKPEVPVTKTIALSFQKCLDKTSTVTFILKARWLQHVDVAKLKAEDPDAVSKVQPSAFVTQNELSRNGALDTEEPHDLHPDELDADDLAARKKKKDADDKLIEKSRTGKQTMSSPQSFYENEGEEEEAEETSEEARERKEKKRIRKEERRKAKEAARKAQEEEEEEEEETIEEEPAEEEAAEEEEEKEASVNGKPVAATPNKGSAATPNKGASASASSSSAVAASPVVRAGSIKGGSSQSLVSSTPTSQTLAPVVEADVPDEDDPTWTNFTGTIPFILAQQAEENPDIDVPLPFHKLMKAFKKLGGLELEGIFKQTPSDPSLVDAVKSRIENNVYKLKTEDARIPGAVIKLWLSCIKVQIFPPNVHALMLKTGAMQDDDEREEEEEEEEEEEPNDLLAGLSKPAGAKEKPPSIRSQVELVISQIPVSHRAVLRDLLALFDMLLLPKNQRKNGLTASSLATIFGDLLTRLKPDPKKSQYEFFNDRQAINKFVEYCYKNRDVVEMDLPDVAVYPNFKPKTGNATAAATPAAAASATKVTTPASSTSSSAAATPASTATTASNASSSTTTTTAATPTPATTGAAGKIGAGLNFNPAGLMPGGYQAMKDKKKAEEAAAAAAAAKPAEPAATPAKSTNPFAQDEQPEDANGEAQDEVEPEEDEKERERREHKRLKKEKKRAKRGATASEDDDSTSEPPTPLTSAKSAVPTSFANDVEEEDDAEAEREREKAAAAAAAAALKKQPSVAKPSPVAVAPTPALTINTSSPGTGKTIATTQSNPPQSTGPVIATSTTVVAAANPAVVTKLEARITELEATLKQRDASLAQAESELTKLRAELKAHTTQSMNDVKVLQTKLDAQRERFEQSQKDFEREKKDLEKSVTTYKSEAAAATKQAREAKQAMNEMNASTINVSATSPSLHTPAEREAADMKMNKMQSKLHMANEENNELFDKNEKLQKQVELYDLISHEKSHAMNIMVQMMKEGVAATAATTPSAKPAPIQTSRTGASTSPDSLTTKPLNSFTEKELIELVTALKLRLQADESAASSNELSRLLSVPSTYANADDDSPSPRGDGSGHSRTPSSQSVGSLGLAMKRQGRERKLSNSIANVAGALASKDADLRKLQEQLHQTQELLTSSQVTIEEKESHIEELEAKMKQEKTAHKQEIERLETRIEEVDRQRVVAEESRTNAKKDADKAYAKLSAAESQLATELPSLRQQLQSQQQSHSELHTAHVTLQSEHEQTLEQLEQQKRKVKELITANEKRVAAASAAAAAASPIKSMAVDSSSEDEDPAARRRRNKMASAASPAGSPSTGASTAAISALQSELLSYKQVISDKNHIIEDHEATEESLKQKIASLEAERDELHAKGEESNQESYQEMQSLLEQNSKVNSELRAVQRELDDLRKQQAAASASPKKGLTSKSSSSASASAELEADIARLTQENKQLQDKLKAAQRSAALAGGAGAAAVAYSASSSSGGDSETLAAVQSQLKSLQKQFDSTLELHKLKLNEIQADANNKITILQKFKQALTDKFLGLEKETNELRSRHLQFSSLNELFENKKYTDPSSKKKLDRKDVTLYNAYQESQRRCTFLESQLKLSDETLLMTKDTYHQTNIVLEQELEGLEQENENLRELYQEVKLLFQKELANATNGVSPAATPTNRGASPTSSSSPSPSPYQIGTIMIDWTRYEQCKIALTRSEHAESELSSEITLLKEQLSKLQESGATLQKKLDETQSENKELKDDLVRTGITLKTIASDNFEMKEFIRENVKTKK